MDVAELPAGFHCRLSRSGGHSAVSPHTRAVLGRRGRRVLHGRLSG